MDFAWVGGGGGISEDGAGRAARAAVTPKLVRLHLFNRSVNIRSGSEFRECSALGQSKLVIVVPAAA